MKKCFKCGAEKPYADFYRHPQMADGYLGKCKSCTKADVDSNRKSNIEYYREYDRRRGSRQPKEYLVEYRAKYPKKYKAQSMVNYMIRKGYLVKEDCECCGSSERIHGHHDDYNLPLKVRWLCAACHSAWHAKHGEAANGS